MSPRKMYPRKTCEPGRGAVGPNPPKCLSPIAGEKGQKFSVSGLFSFLHFVPFYFTSLIYLSFLLCSFIPLFFFYSFLKSFFNICLSNSFFHTTFPSFFSALLPSFLPFVLPSTLDQFLSYFLCSMQEALKHWIKMPICFKQSAC